MPATILFIGALLIAVFYELEGKPSTTRDFLKFYRTRSSWVFIIFIGLTGAFFLYEIYYTATGSLYKSGIPVVGFVKLFILTTTIVASYFLDKKSTEIKKGSKTLRILIAWLIVIFAIINMIGLLK